MLEDVAAVDLVVKARDPSLLPVLGLPPARPVEGANGDLGSIAAIEGPADQLALISGTDGDQHGGQLDLGVIGQPQQGHEIIGVGGLHLEDDALHGRAG